MSAAPPQPLEQRLVTAAGRFAGAVLLLIVAALSLSLLTWTVTDPSLTHATSGAPRNLMGPLGAIVSDLMLQTFGLASLALLLVPMFWGLALMSGGPGPARTKSELILYPVAAFVAAGALSALPVASAWPLYHGYGGIVGDTVFAMTAKVFALVNQSRSGLAAGLVLTAAAGMTLLRASGLSAAELGNALPALPWHQPASRSSAETTAPSTGYVAPGRIEPQLASGFDEPMIHAAASSYAQTEPSLGAPAPDARFSEGLTRVVATAQDKAARGMATLNEGVRRLADGMQRTALPDRGGSSAARAAGYGGPYAQPNTSGWPQQRNDAPAHANAHQDQGFDVTTEEASRAIARRFAPVNGVVDPHADQVIQIAEVDDADPSPSPHHADRERHALSTPMRAPELPQRVAPDATMRATPQSAHPAPLGPFRGSAERNIATDTLGAARQPRSRAPASAAAAVAAPPVAPNATRNGLFGGLKFRHQAEPALKPPPLNLLKKATIAKAGPELTQTVLRGNARLLEDVLGDFGVKGEVRDIRPGPVVTLFEFEPARGVKSSRVIGLADDIARSMSATSARVAVVPGRNAIGIELPNVRRDTVLLRELLESEPFRAPDAGLPIALGKSIGGEPIVADLARMPHLLVAGTTGSGKSVGVNAMILSLLYRLSPDDCRFLMIDPKMLELSVYNGIPHLLAPVVTDPLKAVNALNWVVAEMEERYKRMAKLSVRNIDVYNNRVRNAKKRGEMISRTVQTGFDRRTGEAVYEHEHMALETLPYIVVVIDEFADLMMVAGKEVEASVQRLAQMARAAGIHIIMATQRPSVDVITGTIKANFPTRISFKVTSKIDSRTILNEQGAEQLLGQGDMLYASGTGQVTRVHGAFVSDEEVEAIAAFLRAQRAPDYVVGITEERIPASAETVDETHGQGDQDLYDRAVAIVLRDRKASTSYLQRRLSIGYNRAADLIERMEADRLISAANNVGKREILADSSGSHTPGDGDAGDV